MFEWNESTLTLMLFFNNFLIDTYFEGIKTFGSYSQIKLMSKKSASNRRNKNWFSLQILSNKFRFKNICHFITRYKLIIFLSLLSIVHLITNFLINLSKKYKRDENINNLINTLKNYNSYDNQIKIFEKLLVKINIWSTLVLPFNDRKHWITQKYTHFVAKYKSSQNSESFICFKTKSNIF